jgi:glycerophosphoryl diester phosphodiesterase
MDFAARVSYVVGSLTLASTLHLVACASAKKIAETDSKPQSVMIIGHRGAAGSAPENTIPSFEEAKRLGVTDVELDIQLSKDKVLVLFHDELLDKKTNLKGAVRNFTWAQLSKAEIGSWFDKEHPSRGRSFRGTTLTNLKTVFETFKDAFIYHVEIKAADDEIPQRTLSLFKELNVKSRALITSFYFDQLKRVRALDPAITLCYLIDDKENPDVSAEIKRAKLAGFQQVAVRAPIANKDQTALAHELGLSIRGWGVKTDDDMKRALDAGFEGMTTDLPERLRAELDSRSHSEK